MTTRLRVLLVAAALALPACFDAEPDLGRMQFACLSDVDCLSGYKCRQHDVGKYCTPYTELVDVGQPDPDVQPDASVEPDASLEPDTAGGDAASE